MKFLGEPRSGSFAGQTSSRNRFGQYVRNRATPVNPNSTFQAAVRSRLGTNASAWRAITDVQRAGWLSLGASISRTDSLGQVYTLTGFQAYCEVNNNNAAVGNATVSAAPALVAPTGLATAIVTLTAAAFSIAYTATPLPAGARLMAFASPQRSAGRSFEADYRLISTSAAAAASPLVILTPYAARLGTPVVGQRIFISLAVYLGGFVQAPLILSQVVA
jgi:hypothetical protein